MPTYKATPPQSESKTIITFEAISSAGYPGDGCAPDERDAVHVLPVHRTTPSWRTRSGRAVTMAYCYHTFARESTR